MDLNQLANVGEFIGGVAVIVSLLFVGFEIRQTNATLKSTTSYEALKNFNGLNEVFIADASLSSLVYRLECGEENLDADEKARLHYCLRTAFQHMAAQQFLHRRGLLEDSLWERYITFARAITSTGYGAEWWAADSVRAPYPPEFVRTLNKRA